MKLIECVPNFSEGRNLSIIKAITDEIESVHGVKLLDVDPGYATNRTVVTFAGNPESVLEAAFRAVKKAQQLIDMSIHHGEHPRFGATDVCPIIPISGVSMEEAAQYAHQLCKRIGEELEYPVYMYESAAKNEVRKNLANVRAGEYEGLEKKLMDPEWIPDYGPSTFVPKTGSIAVGARDFLVALNFNLNTTSTRRANAVAFDVREAGRVIKTTLPDGTVQETRQPGKLKAAKAIGWMIEEYGIAQVSMNLTNINITSIHHAFDAVVESATARGMRVTGTEIVGLVPLSVLIDAGKHFLKKQERSVGIPDVDIINIAIKSLGLDDLKPFDPSKKVLEYLLADPKEERLINKSVRGFVEETSRESPAPGGGSVAALLGSLAAALCNMVANLSSHKRGWDDRWEAYSQLAEKGMQLQNKLLYLIDQDTIAFEKVMDAFGLPKQTAEEKEERKLAIYDANFFAATIPFQVMEVSSEIYPLLTEIAETGNQNSISDVGVGVLCATAAIRGAWLNVKINASGLGPDTKVLTLLEKAEQIVNQAMLDEHKILETVNNKIG